MKVYTSYFAKAKALKGKGIVPIGISVYPPKWFDGPNIHFLAPLRMMLSDEVKNEEYIKLYKEKILEKVDLKFLGKRLLELSGGRDVALLCFEKPGDFCHRHLLADYITEKTGVEIIEYSFDEKPKPVEKNIQHTLFE